MLNGTPAIVTRGRLRSARGRLSLGLAVADECIGGSDIYNVLCEPVTSSRSTKLRTQRLQLDLHATLLNSQSRTPFPLAEGSVIKFP